MEPLGAAAASTTAALLRQRGGAAVPLPPSSTAVSVLRPVLSLASARSVSSLAAEALADPDARAQEEAGGSEVKGRRGGLSSLRCLFEQPVHTCSPKSSKKKGRMAPGCVEPRFGGKRTGSRLVKSTGSGVSVGSGGVGEVSPEMASLVRRLHAEGYLRDTNSLKEVDVCRSVGNGYARGVLMATAQRFGEDHQEIAKWLSGSSLKKVALSGCPCTERKTVFAAKRLRSFFSIQEDVVCRGCLMRKSCKFVNLSVNRVDKLILADVMRVLTGYSWDCNLNLQKELTLSVCKSLKEVINLSA